MSDHLKHTNHSYVRYANCWEDADILLEGLDPLPGKKILSVASAGDNSFSLLTCDPEMVVASDINETQLYLCELKKAAIQQLEYEEYLQFSGIMEASNRLRTYELIKKQMPSEASSYWDERLETVEGGVLLHGKFEKYFSLFRKRVVPLIHSRKTVDALFLPRTALEQETFFNKNWNSRRWRLFFKIFFSRLVMGKYGRDPEFLKEVDVSVSQFMLGRAKDHLSSVECQNNYFLHFIFNGIFKTDLPHYLRKENYQLIKQNLKTIVFKKALIENIKTEYGTMDYLNLSNIFEYMNKDYFSKATENIAELTGTGSKIAYWNLMVPRKLSSERKDLYTRDEQNSLLLTARDKGFFYQSFNIDNRL